MKILVVGAHLDDIEIAVGGTIAKAIKAGHTVKAVIMSESGYKDSDGIIRRSNETALKEGRAALKVLGVTDVEIYDFDAKDIHFTSPVVDTLDKVIKDYNPDIVFTHHPFDTHQSHVGVSQSTIAAARRKNTIYFYEPIAPSGRSPIAFKPQLYVDISDTIDLKENSLRKHESEYNKFGGEYWIGGITGRARFRGYEMGSQAAECFEILRTELTF